jgi:hypothetical protein
MVEFASYMAQRINAAASRDVQIKLKGEEVVSPMAQRQNVVVMRDVSMESNQGGVCVTHGAKVKRCRLWKDVKSLGEAIIVGGVCITHDVIIYEICTLPINITSTFLNPPQRKITSFCPSFWNKHDLLFPNSYIHVIDPLTHPSPTPTSTQSLQ